jgi:hypothetical protein
MRGVISHILFPALMIGPMALGYWALLLGIPHFAIIVATIVE